ncbi:hypothetical protein [Streptomyces nigrescens]|uniref:GIY-YIG nuclease family protein n=1 Tax=Streptomyces nigrescens TaxID=1920 RepID=A0ABY7IYT0_STRNI|nr:hypothetical protein [Streptomyces nigrescens]WAU04126.1 hypothetical protein STRNI_002362 [Streptomyces nigrescens]
MPISSVVGRDAFTRMVQRHREEDSPALPIEVGLLRMLDADNCQQLDQDLREFASPWEVHQATENLAPALPDEPGLYMFVWRPQFQFQVDGRPAQGSFPQLLYVGQAGASKSDCGNTIRQRYKEYRRYLRASPESLWTDSEPKTREQRLSRYLPLRPMEFWCTTVTDRNRIRGLEKRLIRLWNPPLNDSDRPKLRGRLGAPRAAWTA